VNDKIMWNSKRKAGAPGNNYTHMHTNEEECCSTIAFLLS